MSKVLISGDRANAARLAAGEWCQAAVFAGLLSQRLRDYKTLTEFLQTALLRSKSSHS